MYMLSGGHYRQLDVGLAPHACMHAQGAHAWACQAPFEHTQPSKPAVSARCDTIGHAGLVNVVRGCAASLLRAQVVAPWLCPNGVPRASAPSRARGRRGEEFTLQACILYYMGWLPSYFQGFPCSVGGCCVVSKFEVCRVQILNNFGS